MPTSPNENHRKIVKKNKRVNRSQLKIQGNNENLNNVIINLTTNKSD